MATPRILAAVIALAFLTPVALSGQAVGQDSADAAGISALIRVVASKDRSQIVRQIRYPLGRPYPVSSIQSAAECMQRFDEVFDAALLSEIAQSDPKQEWGRAGWRGIALGPGDVWLDDDYKIVAINHETVQGKAHRARLIEEQKLRLPSALRDFDEPVLEFNTKHYLIRVDLKGTDYRLLVFKGTSYKTLLYVRPHGDFEFDGSGGNSHIDWVSKDLSFRLFDERLGPGGPEFTFQVFKGAPNDLGSNEPPPFIEETGDQRIR